MVKVSKELKIRVCKACKTPCDFLEDGISAFQPRGKYRRNLDPELLSNHCIHSNSNMHQRTELDMLQEDVDIIYNLSQRTEH